MHTITIYGEDDGAGMPIPREYTFPGGWDEVSCDQLYVLATLMAATTDITATRFFLLQHLAGIPDEVMYWVDAESVTKLVEKTTETGILSRKTTLEGVLVPELDWVFSIPSYRTSLLPEIFHNGIAWRGPSDGLDNFLLAQFAYCDELLNALHAGRTQADLHRFLGALYQPAHSEWSNEPIEEYGKVLSTLPERTQFAALLNYRAIRSTLAPIYERVFAAGDGQPLSSGLFGMVYDVCGSGVFGDIDKTERQLLHRVLHFMEHQLEKEARDKPVPATT